MGQVHVGRVHHPVQDEIVVVADDSAVPLHWRGLSLEGREREHEVEEAEVAKHLSEVVERSPLAIVGGAVYADDVVLVVSLYRCFISRNTIPGIFVLPGLTVGCSPLR